MSVFAQGGASEPLTLVEALRRAPEKSAGVTYVQLNIPGVNRTDYASLHPEAKQIAFFATRDIEASLGRGRVRLLPYHLSEMHSYLTRRASFDLALVQVSPPGPDGQCSFGIAGDVVPEVLARARAVVAAVNPAMPRSAGAPSIAVERLDFTVEVEHPLIAVPTPPPDETLAAIGRHVASLVEDGDTIEFGIGSAPAAVLAALKGHRDLGVHTGLIGDSLVELVESGAITNARKPIDRGRIVAAHAVGTRRLYDALGSSLPVDFRPIGYTHGQDVLARLDSFVAINSVVEVDLLGQANAEMVGGRFVSGTGGLLDFVRGARSASRGRSVLALPSTAAGGKVSRIVPALGTVVSVPRADADFVVTEHGIAALRDRSTDERADSLIAIAAPQFREELARAIPPKNAD
ncbi:MAG: acetyl-CoA hydrolase/transferase C-terminal domain-containing protein [Alphaproteobacteria bacterium]